MLACKPPMGILQNDEGYSPAEMEEVLLSLAGFQDNAVGFYEVKHGKEGADVDPSGEDLDFPGSYLVGVNDALAEKYPESPEPNHHDGLERSCDQVES